MSIYGDGFLYPGGSLSLYVASLEPEIVVQRVLRSQASLQADVVRLFVDTKTVSSVIEIAKVTPADVGASMYTRSQDAVGKNRAVAPGFSTQLQRATIISVLSRTIGHIAAHVLFESRTSISCLSRDAPREGSVYELRYK